MIEITDMSAAGRVYHNIKLLDGRRADVAVGTAIDGLGIEVYVGKSVASGVIEATLLLGYGCPLIISAMQATVDVLDSRGSSKADDLRAEISRRKAKCDFALWLGEQLGTRAYVTSPGEVPVWPPPAPSSRRISATVDEDAISEATRALTTILRAAFGEHAKHGLGLSVTECDREHGRDGWRMARVRLDVSIGPAVITNLLRFAAKIQQRDETDIGGE